MIIVTPVLTILLAMSADEVVNFFQRKFENLRHESMRKQVQQEIDAVLGNPSSSQEAIEFANNTYNNVNMALLQRKADDINRALNIKTSKSAARLNNRNAETNPDGAEE